MKMSIENGQSRDENQHNKNTIQGPKIPGHFLAGDIEDLILYMQDYVVIVAR
jgi:hypothetical protein